MNRFVKAMRRLQELLGVDREGRPYGEFQRWIEVMENAYNEQVGRAALSEQELAEHKRAIENVVLLDAERQVYLQQAANQLCKEREDGKRNV